MPEFKHQSCVMAEVFLDCSDFSGMDSGKTSAINPSFKEQKSVLSDKQATQS